MVWDISFTILVPKLVGPRLLELRTHFYFYFLRKIILCLYFVTPVIKHHDISVVKNTYSHLEKNM